MKKSLKLFTLAFALLFAIVVKVSAKDMTADELLATVSEKTITLTEDVTLTSGLTIPSSVEVIDLGGKTLMLKKGMAIASTLEIKNGTIARDASFISGIMISVSGSTTELTFDGVTVDGKGVEVTSGHAIYATKVKNVVFTNSTIAKNTNADGVAHAVGILSEVEKVELKNTKITDNLSGYSATLRIISCGEFIFDKDSVVSGNIAPEGSGLHIQDTNATIAGTIEDNETTLAEEGNGAGLYITLNDASKTVTIEETAIIRDNTAAGAGGGVYVNGPSTNAKPGTVIMKGGLITGNTAKGTISASKGNETTLKDTGGAGVYVARGALVIEGGTIEKNTSVSGVGDAVLVSHYGKNTEAGKLTINGGTIDGKVKLSETNGEIAITGGAFTDDVTSYIAEKVSKKVIDGVTYIGDSIPKEEVKNPNTGDNVMLFVILALTSLIAAGYAANKLRKNA